VIRYHRRNLDNNTFLTNPDGSPTTFKGAVMGVDKGAMLFPTYWHGALLEPRTAFTQSRRSGINFPVYKDADTALAREALLHTVMEADSRAFMAQRKKAKK
jgi:hypothetical protein